MDFDWLDTPVDLKKLSPKDIEETFEDPFSLRFLPEALGEGDSARYFCLGRSVGGRYVFSVFWTDGKKYRIIAARDMVVEEKDYYDRKNAEFAL